MVCQRLNSRGNLPCLKVDTFYVKANDIGEMQSLRITSDGSRLGSAWHLDRVEVHSSATNEILTFPFRGWIDREHGLSHLLYPDRDGDGVADVGTQAPVKVVVPLDRFLKRKKACSIISSIEL